MNNIPRNVLVYMTQNPLYANDFIIKSQLFYEGIRLLPLLNPEQKSIISQEFAISSMRNNFPLAIRNQIPTASELMARPVEVTEMRTMNVVSSLMVKTFKRNNNISNLAKRTISDFGVQAYQSGEALDYHLNSIDMLDEGDSNVDVEEVVDVEEGVGDNF